MSDSAYWLSPMQAGLACNQPLARDRGTDVIQVEARLESAIEDPVAFRRAWDETVRRHDALRTGFRWRRDGSVEQWAANQVDLPWSTIAPAALPEFLVTDRARGFDLGRPPLVRCALLRDNGFVFTFHHAVLDGRSLHLLFREVLDRYGGHATSEISLPYRCFIDWLAARDDDGDEEFWRAELAGFTQPTVLSDWGTGTAAGAHAEHDLLLSQGFSDRLRALAAAHGLTLNTIFQGA